MWISLGDMNKYLLFPFVGGIVTIIFLIIIKHLKSQFNSYPLVRGVNSGLGMCLSIIPFLILQQRTKAQNKEIYQKIEYYEIKLLEDKKKAVKGKYALLLICAILDFLQKELSFTIIHDSENNVWIFDLIFFTFFSKFILNEKFYTHQYLSLALIIVLLITSIFVLDYKTIKEKPGDFFLVLYIEFVYSINHVLNKYIMDRKFCTPYEVSFYEGLFCLIINIILLSVFSNVEIPKGSGVLKIFFHKNCDGKYYIDNFNYYIKNFNTREFFAFFFSGINKVSYNLFSLFTIKHFTPSHVIIILFFCEIEYFVKTMMRGHIEVAIFLFIILFFLILVFTEIIELNFLGISKNTRRNIRERAAQSENSSSRLSDVFEKRIEMSEGVLVDISSANSESNKSN